MLDLDLDVEADLGIDSIKRVEILTSFFQTVTDSAESLLEQASGARTLRQVLEVARTAARPAEPVSAPVGRPVTAVIPVAEPTSVSPPPPVPGGGEFTEVELTAQMVKLVSDRTGYPSEMLDVDLDLEADLGVDSIKRVEILTALGETLTGLPGNLPDIVNGARTIRQVVETVLAAMPRGAGAPPAGEAAGSTTAAGPQAACRLSRGEMMQRLVKLVADRTGYPAEMLDVDLDLEADLGIDSIKRVEILSSFGESLPDGPTKLADVTAGARTMNEVIDAVVRHLGAEPTTPSDAVAQLPSVDRYLVKLSRDDLPGDGSITIPKGVVIITDDENGAADALQARIRAAGGAAVVTGLRARDGVGAEDYRPIDLASAQSVRSLVSELRQEHGAIGGVIHLLSLREAPTVESMSLDQWQGLLSEEIKSFFYLLSAAAKDLQRENPCWVAAGSSLGPEPNHGSLPDPSRPWRGGLMGMIKSVAQEWPDALCRVVDVDWYGPEEMAGLMWTELSHPGAAQEVYYRDRQRWTPRVTNVPLKERQGEFVLDGDSVILAVGGARGITAEVVREFAARYRPTIILCGSSPWPEAEEALTAGITDEAALKQVLFSKLGEGGARPKPIEVERAYQRILQNREMVANRESFEALGAGVSYIQANVIDGGSVGALLEAIESRHGRLDGIINGAGVIEDKLLEDKTPESFDRVFDVKARFVYALSHLVKHESLKFMVLFSSVAGWFGNRGQSDYAAANEVLNRMAMYLCRQWGRRVVAVNWGPWAKAGMVTDGVKAQFKERGIDVIDPEAGSRYLVDEIEYGDIADALVIAQGRDG